MLHDVAVSDLDLTTIVNPIRKILRHVRFFAGRVEQIDLGLRKVVVSRGFDCHQHALPFDLLVIGLGSVTNHPSCCHGVSLNSSIVDSKSAKGFRSSP